MKYRFTNRLQLIMEAETPEDSALLDVLQNMSLEFVGATHQAAGTTAFQAGGTKCLTYQFQNASGEKTETNAPTWDEYRNRCARAIEWLAGQGVCWRDADLVESDWVIPGETEWAYSAQESVLNRIERHREQLETKQEGNER